jgi:hypothetical protein
MPKFQDCPKCRAKFDVSAFEAGQKFTCGSCGTVVTAHAAAPAGPVASRIPGGAAGASPAPSRPVPSPSQSRSSVGGGSGRGPQYKPLDRGAAAVETAGPAHRETREEREERRAALKEKKGVSPAVFAGIAAGVLAAVVGVYFATKKDDAKDKPAGGGTSVANLPAKPGTGPAAAPGTSPAASSAGRTDPKTGVATPGTTPPPPSGDTVGAVDAERKKVAHPTVGKYREFMGRYKSLGDLEKAKDVAKELLAVGDPNDVEAHKLLGHMEFTGEVPEEISFRKYPFVRAVEEAKAQRWFDDAEGFALAMKAFERTQIHAQKLESDRVYRALDGARRAIDRDEHFKKYNYDSIFASPYLICYSTDDRIDPEDFLKLPASERRKKFAELDKKRETYKRVLAEKAKIYTQLYAEFLKRYGEACDLHDLMEEYGGRKDLPISKRSFPDGCPLIVWIFSDRAAFDSYHNNVKKDPISPGVAGYFSPDTGWVYLYDEEGGNREFEINKNVHEGTHQLQHWFMRQKNEWGKASVPQSFFGEGFAEYMGSVVMEKDRKLTFIGLNRPRLESLDNIKTGLQKQTPAKSMLVFPVKELVGFEGYHNVSAWAAEHWGAQNGGMGLGIFYIQSWAFTYFMNEYSNHKYQARFGEFLSSILNYPKDAENYGFTKFKQAFGIASEADWKKLDKEFKDYYLGTLGKMKTDDIGKQPPRIDDWPGYVAPDLLAPDAAPAEAPKKDDAKNIEAPRKAGN